MYGMIDGDGVRGLSSLLILQNLMKHVNMTIQDERHDQEKHEKIEPKDVFDFVAGTSTGGLIAIMLGKLGMTLEECIQAYRDLSRNIFSNKHFRGRMTLGMAVPRYSGNRFQRHIQDLIRSRNIESAVAMDGGNTRDPMPW